MTDYAVARAASKKRRAENRHRATEHLLQAGLRFEERNYGAHLIVHAPDGRAFYLWPGTGRWHRFVARGKTYSALEHGRGVLGLIRYLKES